MIHWFAKGMGEGRKLLDCSSWEEKGREGVWIPKMTSKKSLIFGAATVGPVTSPLVWCV